MDEPEKIDEVEEEVPIDEMEVEADVDHRIAHFPAPGSLPVDPNEPTYCTCQQVSFGEMIAVSC